jgi:hypothetical protein
MTIAAWLSAMGIEDPAMQGTVLHGLLVLLGLVLAALLLGWAYAGSRRAARHAERRLREQHVLLLLSALRADARACWHWLDSLGGLEARSAELAQRIEEGRWTQPTFTPIVPGLPPSAVAATLDGESFFLAHALVDAIVRYRRQHSLIEQTLADLRSERFANMPADARIELVRFYFAQLAHLKQDAFELNAALEDALRLKRGARDTRMQPEPRPALVLPPRPTAPLPPAAPLHAVQQ